MPPARRPPRWAPDGSGSPVGMVVGLGRRRCTARCRLRAAQEARMSTQRAAGRCTRWRGGSGRSRLPAAASRTLNPLLLGAIIGVAALVVAARRSEAPWAASFRAFLMLGVARPRRPPRLRGALRRADPRHHDLHAARADPAELDGRRPPRRAMSRSRRSSPRSTPACSWWRSWRASAPRTRWPTPPGCSRACRERSTRWASRSSSRSP